MQTGRTLTAVIEDALREMLARQSQQPTRQQVRLKRVRGHGLQPGVDLDSSAALLEWMETHKDDSASGIISPSCAQNVRRRKCATEAHSMNEIPW